MLTEFGIIVSISHGDDNLLCAPQPQWPLPIFGIYEQPCFLQQDEERKAKFGSQSQMEEKKKENVSI